MTLNKRASVFKEYSTFQILVLNKNISKNMILFLINKNQTYIKKSVNFDIAFINFLILLNKKVI